MTDFCGVAFKTHHWLVCGTLGTLWLANCSQFHGKYKQTWTLKTKNHLCKPRYTNVDLSIRKTHLVDTHTLTVHGKNNKQNSTRDWPDFVQLTRSGFQWQRGWFQTPDQLSLYRTYCMSPRDIQSTGSFSALGSDPGLWWTAVRLTHHGPHDCNRVVINPLFLSLKWDKWPRILACRIQI